jgi:hypothetical protein
MVCVMARDAECVMRKRVMRMRVRALLSARDYGIGAAKGNSGASAKRPPPEAKVTALRRANFSVPGPGDPV